MRLRRFLFDGTSTFRRGPRFDLEDYARRRGFEPLGGRAPSGVVGGVGLDPRLRFNVTRCPVDGAPDVVLAHVLEPFGFGTGDTRFRPWTVAALPMPEAIGTLVRVNARSDQEPTTGPAWRRLDADAVGLPGYMVEGAPSTDEALLARALTDGAAAWLAGRDGRLGLDFGCLWLAQRDFTADPGELDDLRATIAALGERLRRLSLAALAPTGFPEVLPPPAATFDLPHTSVDVRDWVPAFARRRGLIAEDPLAFHRAFPSLPLAGRAFAVFRGGPARLVATTEVRLPDNLGEDAALLKAADDAPDSAPWALADGATAEVRAGVLVVKRPRTTAAGISGPGLLRLGELAAGLAMRKEQHARQPLHS